ncbi:PvuII DNA methyltransferase [Fulvivirga imtechensis AK7]|uniref:Methyltransferase n=1 Tax=Fulvivirga imtechensis AK7 TaxID=1237149 RepID=L8JQ35_9BACT|nr:site-specific DNA-methyltransferase [Fulvivirga imtechensis]ELR71071.1 PvuII DNA methyltransferase [Fulvivirga imtechensis AK7]
MKTKYLYKTNLGKAYVGDSLNLLDEIAPNSIDLIVTSPPFALLRQKEYGNKDQNEYVNWLLTFTKKAHSILKDTGSIVIDLGGAYKKGVPVRSLYNYRFLIRACDEQNWHLAEEFFWFNPAKLPSPIEWVNKRKIRVKDSVNTVWWLSKKEFPKADVKNVLIAYSDRMKKLLDLGTKYYDPKLRPSGHDISEGFNKDNGGAIPPNILPIPNTESNSQYLKHCKNLGEKGHPARFPAELPGFFIKYLTDPEDTVLDIFAGSNTTGWVAEQLNRRWISFDSDHNYLANSAFRFLNGINHDLIKEIHQKLLSGKHVGLDIRDLIPTLFYEPREAYGK